VSIGKLKYYLSETLDEEEKQELIDFLMDDLFENKVRKYGKMPILMTQSEYDILSQDKKMDINKIYKIK
jgi:hypothetical protein